MVEVERRRLVVDVIEDRAEDPHAERNRPVVAVLQALVEEEIGPEFGDVRHSEDGEIPGQGSIAGGP